MVLPLRPALITATVGLAVLSSLTLTAPAQAGQTALPGLERISYTGSPANIVAHDWTYCTPGKSITGGGGEIFGGKGQVGLLGYMNGERERNDVYAHEDDDHTDNTWTLTSYAICTDGPARQWVFAQTILDHTESKSITATCPAGTVLTGGGGDVSGWGGGGQGDVILDDVVPRADLQQLTVSGYEDQDGAPLAWDLIAGARCGAPLPGQQRIAATSATDSISPKSVTATCPSGQRVIGTGHELTNARGQVLLDDVVPNAALTSVRVEAFEDQDGTTNTWSVTAYAICADA